MTDILELLVYHDRMFNNCFMDTVDEEPDTRLELESVSLKAFQSFAANFPGLSKTNTTEFEFVLDLSPERSTNPKDYHFVVMETNITCLMGVLFERSPQFLGDLCHSLWNILCSQTQIGPAYLKEVRSACIINHCQASLHTLHKLLLYLDLPGFVADEILFSMLSLLSIELIGQEESVVEASLGYMFWTSLF